MHTHEWSMDTIGDTLGDGWLYARCTVAGCNEMVDCGAVLATVTMCPECGFQLCEGYCWTNGCSQFNVSGDPAAFDTERG